MDINKYQQLKDKIQNNNFERSYSVIDKILFYFSFLGNTASVIFAYFFVNVLLFNATDEFWGKSIIVPMISFVALSAFEMLKRFLFRQTTVNFLSSKKINKDTIATLALSLLLIASSFYLSLNGAEKMADKGTKIDNNTEVLTNQKTDSLNKVYDIKITKLDKDKDTWVKLIQSSRGSALKTQYNEMINKTTADIKALNMERDSVIKIHEAKVLNKSSVQKQEVSSNIMAFIMISTFIELIILIGVWFDSYYEYRSFTEFDDKVSSDENIKNFLLYSELMEVAYNGGKLKKGEDFDSMSKFKDVVKIKKVKVSDKGLTDFFTILKYLKISATVGNRRVVEKNYDDAKEILAEYYKL